MPEALDLGCGQGKRPGAWGVDLHPFTSVDQVMDLDQYPWPLESSSFTRIFAHHIIEHIEDPKAFMNELHRVAKPNGEVEIVTPHFSSLDSWKDPTHRWHLSAGWHEVFTSDYLAAQVLPFEHLSTQVGFPRNIRGSLARFIIHMRGLEHWEKRHAFVLRGKNIRTVLRVLKED